ncbi:putative metalloprotease with PDZ domain [Flavobacteriaceae bacterium MAR_2010_105]|nr:putative metalloprotease with PDZ domain [Flavobacteriaceae bacterium MAR_2010_105]
MIVVLHRKRFRYICFMNRIFGLLVAGITLVSCGTSSKNIVSDLAENNSIETSIDLTVIVDDKAPVTINPGRFTQDEVIYRLPRVVQGTYEYSNFGNYTNEFTALDYDGNPLKVERIDDNSWLISNADKLDKITYLVNDTYDIERSGEFKAIFSPEGTNFSDDNFVLNLHGLIGYFDSLKRNSYTLDVTSPAHFVRTSALQETKTMLTNDNKIISSYFAPRYFDITDNPMMMGELDVEEFMVGDIKIVLSLYSPNKVHTAKNLKETVYKMMEAQKAYLGPIDTTKRYDIYLFLSDGSATSPKGFGALEHHTSTVVVLGEFFPKSYLEKAIIDIVAHEFFHIVTPLGVHSEDVHYFDYHTPSFSKHLWMYEGVTEYFAEHFQVYERLVTEEEFYNTIMQKISNSKRFNDSMSFTMMSEHIIEPQFASNFVNVYEKGALIGMCLDIIMLEESHGARNLLSLMKELSLKYGKEKPFEDDFIIEEITKMTYPAIGSFFKTYVEGDTPINYSDFFEKVGLNIDDLGKLTPVENPRQSQLELRKMWLNSKEKN